MNQFNLHPTVHFPQELKNSHDVVVPLPARKPPYCQNHQKTRSRRYSPPTTPPSPRVPLILITHTYMLAKLSTPTQRVLMEKEFQFQFLQKQPTPLGGGESSPVSINDAYVNGLLPGLSFRSLLTYSPSDPAALSRSPLKMPKIEPLFAGDEGVSGKGSPPYNFISEADSSSLGHQQLPSLLSFEPPQYTASVESPTPNPRLGKVSTRPARDRRQKLSEKTRCLQKLLPRNQKMDMATVLEESYKYIKFLEAQVSVLRSMPREIGGGAPGMNVVGVGDLGKLNRQQLLQVVVNSPVAQTQLYSKGCCLFSVEQLGWLKKNAERNALYHQMVLDSYNPNPNSSFLENDGRGCSFF